MRKRLFTLLILLIIVLPVNTYALTGNTKITCSKTTVNPGETFTCAVTGTASGDTVSGISSDINLSSNLTLESFTTDSIWEGDGENGDIELYTDENKSGTFNIGVIKLKANSSILTGSNETIKLINTEFTNSSYNESTISDTTVNIRIASTINTLATLSLSKGTLTPTFDKNVTSYSATVDAENVNITATSGTNATLTGDTGTKNLKYGLNSFKITVTSESKSSKTYTININRPDNRSKDNTLSSLIIGNDEIELKEGIYEYSYKVDSNITQIKIDATLNDKKASFIDEFGSRNVTLKDGDNKILIKVIAENKEEKVYTININKPSNTNENNTTDNNDNNTNNNTDNNNAGTNNIENPKTGSTALYITLIITLLSIVAGIYVFKKKVQGSEVM